MVSIARACTNFKYKEIYMLKDMAELIYFSSYAKIKVYKSLINKNLSYGRILIILPKKIGNSPFRNLIKRRIRAIFFNRKIYTLKYDFVFIAQKGIDKLSFNELENIFINMYQNLSKSLSKN
jgi:ribonuclease P protein component